jgi:prepilin-type N-terminal cleavage/methylation domain-containing protein
MKNTNAKKKGFTLVEIMIVVAIIGLLAAIAIPNFVRARTTSQMNACINNLRLIDSACQQWALEQHQGSAAQPGPSDIQPYLGHGTAGELPSCPADTTAAGGSYTTSYTVYNISIKPQCLMVNSTHILP